MLPALVHLSIGCTPGQALRRSSRRTSVETDAPFEELLPVETDQHGATIYVDLLPERGDAPCDELIALQSRLATIRPSTRALERLKPINKSRVLVEIEDVMALTLFSTWIHRAAMEDSTGEALMALLVPIGRRIRLLGAHFICPRVTEYEPFIAPQVPHTDVDRRGEVFGIGLHVSGEPMGTLMDPNAHIDSDGNVCGGVSMRRASTSAFAFDTGAVHAGPGRLRVEGPYPRYFTDRVFFLFCAADLDAARIAKHRADNGLVGQLDLVVSL